MAKIVIDPGHGGHDSGAAGFGLQEKSINLDIALEIRRLLANFADITLTRTSDVYVSLSDRSALANRIGADLFISIHVNAGKGTGFESYVFNNAPASTVNLVQPIHKKVAAFYKDSGFTDRGQKKANFAVLRQTLMPATLLENLFIDTQKDADKLKDPAFRKEIAGAIADGVKTTLKLDNNITQPTPQPTPQPVSESPEWAVENFNKIKKAGLVLNDHDLAEQVTWGELSAVMARLLDKLNM